MRSRSTDSRNSCSVDLRAVISTNVSTTPSIRLSEVRYGVRRIAYQRRARVTTSRSTGLKSLSTAAMSLLRSEPSRLLETSESGRPRSEGIRLNRLRIVGVKSLIRVSASTKSVPISVEFTRLRMSLVVCDCSSILIFSSWFTVVSSSLTDWSSSLLVSSSSAEDRSSSLLACSSSFEDLSSSVCASVLFHGGLELLLESSQLLLEMDRRVAEPSDRFHRLRYGPRGGSALLEQNEKEAARRITGSQYRFHRNRHGFRCVRHTERQPMCLHGLPALRGLVQRRSHFEPQLRPDRLATGCAMALRRRIAGICRRAATNAGSRAPRPRSVTADRTAPGAPGADRRTTDRSIRGISGRRVLSLRRKRAGGRLISSGSGTTTRDTRRLSKSRASLSTATNRSPAAPIDSDDPRNR